MAATRPLQNLVFVVCLITILLLDQAKLLMSITASTSYMRDASTTSAGYCIVGIRYVWSTPYGVRREKKQSLLEPWALTVKPA